MIEITGMQIMGDRHLKLSHASEYWQEMEVKLAKSGAYDISYGNVKNGMCTLTFVISRFLSQQTVGSACNISLKTIAQHKWVRIDFHLLLFGESQEPKIKQYALMVTWYYSHHLRH